MNDPREAVVGRLPMAAVTRAAEVDLDGEWEFQLLERPDAPWSEAWQVTTLPSLWTMSEPADGPHYTNVPMPFDDVPPTVPLRNPTGIYRRDFELSAPPARRVILHVGAAEGRLTVFVNDQLIGSSTDSHLAAEFDITEAVVEGRNSLVLKVAKWSRETYLEDQDHWWHGGISRSVWIHTVPVVHISDVVAIADYDADSGVGSLDVTVTVSGVKHLAEIGHGVRVSVLGGAHEIDVSGRVAAPTLPKMARNRSEKPAFVFPPDMMDMLSIGAASAPIPPEFRAIPNGMLTAPKSSGPAGTARLELADLAVAPWSAERPHLEVVRIELIDPAGDVVDETGVRVGFRRVRVQGRDLLINGQRVLIQGVNRHDFDPHTGRVMTRQRILDELALLKRFNVNAIRCAHYPNDPVLLDLCDEIGLYVVDEADVEGHAFASTIADDPEYLTPIVERVARMVLRDRNHPSVIVWSLGNETGYGAAHDAAAAWVRRIDPTRPVQYEGAVSTDWHGGHGATDLVVPMYPSFAAIEAYAADSRSDRPFISCEYAYSQGNSTGGLAEYWRLFESLPGLQGGFIWEFVDHALDPDAEGEFRYGGDFGDFPNSGGTVLNGIVLADLTPKPALYEARGIFSPVRIVSDAADALRGRIRLRSRRHFADLSDLVIDAHLETRDGRSLSQPLSADDLAPGAEREFELDAEIVHALRGERVLAISVTIATKNASLWASAGTELAVQQIVLPFARPAVERSGAPVDVDEDGEIRHSLLASPPRLSLWRAMTDNDASFALDPRFVSTGFFSIEPIEVEIDQSPDSTRIHTLYRAAFGDTVVHERRIARDEYGGFVFDETVHLPEGTGDGLRVGIAFELVEGFEKTSWVGLGPWENYPDRRASALVGRWESTIDELAVPYVIPQENGTRGGVDSALISGRAGSVELTADQGLHLNVSRYSVSELEDATHWWRLPASERTFVHLDIAHRGVGTGLLGPDTQRAFRLSGSTYTWRWRLGLEEGRR